MNPALAPKPSAPRQLSLFKGRKQRGTRPPPAPEFNIQCMVADDLEKFGARGWIYTHIPSGGLRDIRTAARLKRMGVVKGFPDLVLWDSDGRSYFLELKRKGGRLSEHQKAIQAWCQDRPLVRHAVAYSYQEARAQLVEWGALRGVAP